MDISTVQLQSSGMDYFTFGSREKIIVILPGMGIKSVMLSAEEIVADYSILADNYTVYVFDRIKEMPDGYSVFDMADDTAEALEILGISGAHLYGMSQGGMIAQVMAAKYPHLVKKLILGSTHYKPGEVSDKVFSRWIELSREKNAGKAVENMMDLIYTDDFLKKYRELISSLYADTTEEELRRFGIMAEACLKFDFRDGISDIKCPTLVIGAENDRVMPAYESEEMAKALGCECYIYKGYSHAVCDEAPDYKEKLLNFFLKQTP